MTIAARGLPVHTRNLSIGLFQGDDEDLTFRSHVLDLRKRGVVPVGGHLQGTGIIHQMHLDGVIDPVERRYGSVAARMPSVAFEPTAGTGGESCRDPIENVAKLSGLALTDGYARGVSGCIGGVLGCSHLLALAQLLGPSVIWALDANDDGARAPGECLFRRDITLDGFVDGDALVLLAQLNDLHFRPHATSATTPDLFGAQTEIRVRATVSLDGMRMRDVSVEERRRTLATLESTPWRSRDERASLLEDTSLAAGFTARLLDHFRDAQDERPLLDTLLTLAPGTIQCLASYRDTWTAMSGGRAAEVGGHTDSCYMWRAGGALEQRRPENEG